MKRIVWIPPLVVLVLLAGAGMLYYRWCVRPLPIQQSRTIIVQPGAPLSDTADKLATAGVLHSAWDLVWLARIEGKTTAVRAGEYALPAHITTARLLGIIVSGKVVLHSFTIVDGWTFREFFARLEDDPLLKHDLAGLSDAEIMKRIGHSGENPEGRFFPETYKFPRGTTDSAFLKRAYNLMQRHLADEWASRDADMSLKTPYQSLILASIIEKETGLASEMRRIAGVFVRRLRRGMRLGSDPTVIYGLGKAYNGDITARDLRTDTPYNTYTRKGLPPTPISLPSLAALHAAMHPQRGDALYFVSKGDGSHEFSATFEEHRKAVKKYQIDGKHGR